jgi:transposase
MIHQFQDVTARLSQRIAELEKAMDALVRQRQRRRGDPGSADQPLLFPDHKPEGPQRPSAEPTAEETAPASPPVDPPTPPPAEPASRRGHGRRSRQRLLEQLPRERREHTLTEVQRLCPCCGGLRHKIGEQVTHQLEYVPARMLCVEHVQFTYSCPHCPEHIETTPKPPQPIERGLAGPGLLAMITTHKFDDYLPLYRQELMHARYGAFLARSTLCDWLQAVGDLVAPLIERMREEVFRSRVVQTDGTAIQVVERGQSSTRTGYLWPYLGDAQHPLVVMDFSLDKRKEHPQTFLRGYRGYVQVDAYSAYDGCFLSDPENPKVEVGCWSHAERYVEEAELSDPRYVAEGLAFIRSLFDVERRAKDRHLPEQEVLALRQREALPILAEFHTWLTRTRERVLPRSPMATAIRYVLNQWQALCRYTETGFLSMDNNATERINKLIARGRINWLFVGRRDGVALTQPGGHMPSSSHGLVFVFTRCVYTSAGIATESAGGVVAGSVVGHPCGSALPAGTRKSRPRRSSPASSTSAEFVAGANAGKACAGLPPFVRQSIADHIRQVRNRVVYPAGSLSYHPCSAGRRLNPSCASSFPGRASPRTRSTSSWPPSPGSPCRKTSTVLTRCSTS